MSFWVYLTSDLNAYTCFFYYGEDNYAGTYFFVGTDATGTTLLAAIGATEVTGPSLSTGTWYFITIDCNWSAAAYQTSVRCYNTSGTQVGSTINVAARPSISGAGRFEFGGVGSGNNDRLNGRVAAVKRWDGTRLSAADLLNEQWTYVPKRFAGPTAWWPGFNGSPERLADYGPSAYNFTAGGTLTDEDGPPITWGGQSYVLPYAAVSDQTITASGVASGEAFGAATVTQPAGDQTITASAIAGAEAFGTARLDQAITPAGLTSAEAFGAAQLNLALSLTGIATGAAFGTAALAVAQQLGAFGVPAPGLEAGRGLRFYGNGTGNIDRVRIPLDTGGASTPADVGAGDATYECWIKFNRADNTADITGGGDVRNSNIFFDRDIWGHQRGWCFGLTRSGSNTFVCWGCADVGGGWGTIIGNTNVGDGAWHHVAFTWQQSTRTIRMYVDGTQQTNTLTLAAGNTNLSYPDGYDPGLGQNNPYLVLGAEKHDAGGSYPSYNGQMDELRISDSRRYTASFTRPSARFEPDANTMALYHMDDGSGTVLADQSAAAGGPTNGELLVGGTPSGPEWITSDAPISLTAFGTLQLNLALALAGIASGEAFGALRLDQAIAAAGLASAEAFGTTVVSAAGTTTVSPAGIATGEALGAAVVTPGAVTISPSGVASGEALGSPVIQAGTISIVAVAIGSGETFGAAVLQPGAVTVSPASIASGQAFGAAQLDLVLLAVAIAGGEAFGVAVLQPGPVTVSPAGIAAGELFGLAEVLGGLSQIPAMRSPLRATAGGSRTQAQAGTSGRTTAAAGGTGRTRAEY